jgi:hypothetical protein
MSNVPDLGLDLENLFQPAWAQGKPEANRFEKFSGNEGERPERRGGDRGDKRGPRRENFGGERRENRSPRPVGKFGGKKDFHRNENREEPRERFEPPAPLPEITVTFLPGENGVESLARQIKMTGRAYPLFDIARLVLEKPERYSVQLAVHKKSDGAVAQPLFICALDDSPWLSEDEVIAHVLQNHFATFYQTERIATEPPKGVYTFVAQCGMSGAILGPPNYHDYQNQLRKLHAEKFSRMPFEVFKSRVKIVKDEAVVKKWIEEQSFKTEFSALNVAEPLKIPTMDEVEKHFRATHKDAIIKSVTTHTVAGVPSRNLRNRDLQRLVRAEWDHQKYFPLQLAMTLSKQFASHGLQFFKVNKTIVHVSVARPQFLDLETTPVSESIRRIVEFIDAHPKSSRRKLIEALAPTPTTIEVKPDEQKSTEPTAEQTAVISDLHWLIHQGHVLEFADGRLETAKKPLPRPAKTEKKNNLIVAEPKVETQANGEVQPAAEIIAEISAPVENQTPSEMVAPAEEIISPAEETLAAEIPAP